MMIDCPLLEGQIAPSVCGSCMYRSQDGDCLNSVPDTTDFARARGVKASDVETVRVRAEQRIQAGLCLYEYLAWIRDVGIELPPLNAKAAGLIAETPFLAELGVTSAELVVLADAETWGLFQTSKGLQFPFRHAQVLLITEAQLDELNAPI